MCGLPAKDSKSEPLPPQFLLDCLTCPEHASTVDVGSTAFDHCICDPGFFDASASFAVDLDLLAATSANPTDVGSLYYVLGANACVTWSRSFDLWVVASPPPALPLLTQRSNDRDAPAQAA